MAVVFNLNARRLGHALSLRKSPDLICSIAERQITIEMCPYANYQINGYPLYLNGFKHNENELSPLKYYLDSGIKVTVNTDNIGISSASLIDNFMLLYRLNPSITRKEILCIIRNSVEGAFLSTKQRSALLARVEWLIVPPEYR